MQLVTNETQTTLHFPHVHEHTNDWMDGLGKVCAVALAAFSFYTDWQLFLPFFFFGTALGIHSAFQKESSSCHHPQSASCCSPLDFSLGVTLPAPITLAASMAITVCHIDHHSHVFVPIRGLIFGAWVGKSLTGLSS